jgi:hypothetical protein
MQAILTLGLGAPTSGTTVSFGYLLLAIRVC